MSNYLPHGQSKNRLFRKREQELLRIVHTETDSGKIEKVLRKFLEAKIQVHKSRGGTIPVGTGDLEEQIQYWFSKSSVELIEEYRRKQPNQTSQPTSLRDVAAG